MKYQVQHFFSLLQSIPRHIWVLTLFFYTIYSVAAIGQWYFFGMDGYDIGIFNQVLWNSAQGNLFEYSFNPYSYFVDHRSILLIGLIPLYWMVAHPVILLIVQAGIAAVVIPIVFVVARNIFEQITHSVKPIVAGTVASVLYAMHPTIWHMQIQEFHMLPVLIPLSVLFVVFYQKKQWQYMSAIIGLMLLVREDVAVMTIGIGCMMLLFPRKEVKKIDRYYGSSVVVISSIVLSTQLYIGKLISPFEQSKFLALYDWAGLSVREIVLHWVTHPLETISVMVGNDHLLTIIILLCLFAFVPLFSARWTIPALLPFGLFLFIQEPILQPILFSHYAAFIFPWLFVAMLYGYMNVMNRYRNTETVRQIFSVSVVICIGIQVIMFSPVMNEVHKNVILDSSRIEKLQATVERISEEDAVMATPALYSHLSSRSAIFPTLHVMEGTYHFTDIPYEHSGGIDWMLFERSEIALYRAVYSEEELQEAFYRFQNLITANNLSVIESDQYIVVYGKGEDKQTQITELEQLFFGGSIEITSGSIIPFSEPHVEIVYE